MICGYVHIATMGDWRHILGEHLSVIQESGLYNACQQIDLCKVGKETLREHAWASEDPDLGNFEYPTLARLYEQSAIRKGISFYSHLKGVSKTTEHWAEHKDFYKSFAGLTTLESLQHNERLWRKYMEYFIFSKYKDCIDALDAHDICGVHWRDKPFPHFSGNFWWARNDYIRTLRHPTEFRKMHEDYRDEMGSNRSIAEFWIGSGRPRVAVLYNNAMNLYHEGIKPSTYAKTPFL